MHQPSVIAPNRKLPPLPPAADLPDDDPRHWAILFTTHRLRLGWTLTTLAAFAGVSDRTATRACSTGHCTTTTALKLARALSLPLP